MKEMVSAVKTVGYTAAKSLIEGAKRQLQAQRGTSVPDVVLVNKFDIDQKDFLTTPMKGFSMVQRGAGGAIYNTLTVQADYGIIPPGHTQAVRPIPGQPALNYPVAAQSGSFNTSFIRSGGSEPKRIYPVKLLLRDSYITVVSS